MSYIIDRRLNSKKKSMVNRQRFIGRYREHIRKAVSDAVDKRSITDIERGEKISIPKKDTDEPVFRHGKGGENTRVLPGNDQFIAGDHIPRPQGQGSGGSGSGASDSGEGMDEFVFQITQEEFLNFVFEDLELPNLIKRQLSGLDEFEFRRAGFSNEGNPGQVNVVRSLRAANARRIALTGKKRKKLKLLEAELAELEDESNAHTIALKNEIEKLKRKIKRVPWLDDYDLKYNLHVKKPLPHSKAVMFCLMDVSGSMDQATKDIAKRFFLLLFLFLKRNYKHIDVVFIRHHTSAKEVNEEEFFYSRETGGTIVSSALKLMHEIVSERYPASEWNIYAAQASDGDNWNDDSVTCQQILRQNILSYTQYFSYIEITNRERQALWHAYEQIQREHFDNFAMKHLVGAEDIYPVFRELFHKKAA